MYYARFVAPGDDKKRKRSGGDTATIVAALLNRLEAGDATGVGELFAEEIDWYVPGPDDLPWTGRRTRPEEVSEFFLTLMSQFKPDTSTTTLDRILIDGDGAAIFTTVERTFASSGLSFTNPMVMLLEVGDAKIVKLHMYEDTRTIANAYYG